MNEVNTYDRNTDCNTCAIIRIIVRDTEYVCTECKDKGDE
jgi:hypothetical protein